MAIEYLSDWRNEYINTLTKKRDEYEDLSIELDQKITEIDKIEKKINSDDEIFNPNDMFSQERVRLKGLFDEKDRLKESLEKVGQNINYLEERINSLNEIITEIDDLKSVLSEDKKPVITFNKADFSDQLQFLSEIAESDPRRCKIELLHMKKILNDNVSRET